jgi:hypothetical protein
VRRLVLVLVLVVLVLVLVLLLLVLVLVLLLLLLLVLLVLLFLFLLYLSNFDNFQVSVFDSRGATPTLDLDWSHRTPVRFCGAAPPFFGSL